MSTWPATARKLLEARYKAFEKADVDFVVESTHPDTRKDQDRESIEKWAKESKWLGLDIEDEAVDKDVTHIKFTCHYEEKDGNKVEHKEIAEFRLFEDKWYYYDSKGIMQPFKRETPKIGRNEPCSCGSGKKFKKCCGK